MAFNQIIAYLKERGAVDSVEEKHIPHSPSCAAADAAVQLTFDNMLGWLLLVLSDLSGALRVLSVNALVRE